MILWALPDPTRLDLISQIRDCRSCEVDGIIPAARPVLQWPEGARIGVFGQAPGNLAHQEQKPFCDPSGDRLRSWMGVTDDEFYESGRVAIIPMAFCFPGYDGTGATGKGGDRPPPKACAEKWRSSVMDVLLPTLSIILLVGAYAQKWHLPGRGRTSVTQTVAQWRDFAHDGEASSPTIFPLPHPSWRTTGWRAKNPWFEEELLPVLQSHIREAMTA